MWSQVFRLTCSHQGGDCMCCISWRRKKVWMLDPYSEGRGALLPQYGFTCPRRDQGHCKSIQSCPEWSPSSVMMRVVSRMTVPPSIGHSGSLSGLMCMKIMAFTRSKWPLLGDFGTMCSKALSRTIFKTSNEVKCCVTLIFICPAEFRDFSDQTIPRHVEALLRPYGDVLFPQCDYSLFFCCG